MDVQNCFGKYLTQQLQSRPPYLLRLLSKRMGQADGSEIIPCQRQLPSMCRREFLYEPEKWRSKLPFSDQACRFPSLPCTNRNHCAWTEKSLDPEDPRFLSPTQHNGCPVLYSLDFLPSQILHSLAFQPESWQMKSFWIVKSLVTLHKDCICTIFLNNNRSFFPPSLQEQSQEELHLLRCFWRQEGWKEPFHNSNVC